MAISLSDVNISIQQFQRISSGKYNAGLVTLESETTLGKTGHHVTFGLLNSEFFSRTPSHAEVLALKDAFVRALAGNGVGAAAIDGIRRQLGLAPDGRTDISFAERSVRPLTRQQVREILDANAGAINRYAGAGTILTQKESNPGYTEQEYAGFARTRTQVNAEVARSRRIPPDQSLADEETVISGAIHGISDAQRNRLVAVAERQKQTILELSHGSPSTDANGTFKVVRQSDGLSVTFALGMSEADYVRKLDDTILQLKMNRRPTREMLAAFDEFSGLEGADARKAWVYSLPEDPQSARRVRSVAVALLFRQGVDDWETLSLVNKVPDALARTFLVSYIETNDDGRLRGDDLRTSFLMKNLRSWVGDGSRAASPLGATFIPALMPLEANANAMNVLSRAYGSVPTRETDEIKEAVVAEFRRRFGEGVFGPRPVFFNIVSPGAVSKAFKGVDLSAARLTKDEIVERILAAAAPAVASTYLCKAVRAMIQAEGGDQWMAQTVASNVLKRHPQLTAQLAAATSPEEASAVIDDYRVQIEAGIRRQTTIERCRGDAEQWCRERIAAAMNIPVSSLREAGAINLARLRTLGNDLGTEIAAGRNPADGDAAIESCYRELAAKLADERIRMMEQVKAMNIPEDARDILTKQILTIENVSNLDLAAIKALADGIQIDDFVAAISGDRPVAGVVQAMSTLNGRIDQAARGLFVDENGIPKGGGEDTVSAASLLVTLALARRPESFGLMRAFFARPDAAGVALVRRTDDDEGVNAVAFQIFRPDRPAAETNAQIALALDKPVLAPIYAQAVSLGLADLGLAGLSEDERAKLLAGGTARSIASRIRNSAAAVTPSGLRRMVREAFADLAARTNARKIFSAVAEQHDVRLSPATLEVVASVLAGRDRTIFARIKDAVRAAADSGGDPVAAADSIIAPHAEVLVAAVRAFGEIEKVNATAVDSAVQQIAARSNLDPAYVRSRLGVRGLVMEFSGSLNLLRGDVKVELANPNTDASTYDIGDVARRAAERVEKFIRQKVGFIAELDGLGLSEAATGNLIARALEQQDYKNKAHVQIAARVLAAPETKAMLASVKQAFSTKGLADRTDEYLFHVLESFTATVDEVMDGKIDANERRGMDVGDITVIRQLVTFAMLDFCGDSLKEAAEILTRDRRFDDIAAAGRTITDMYNNEYLEAAGRFGLLDMDQNADPVQKAAAERAAANAERRVGTARAASNVISIISAAVYDDWLPADVAEDFRNEKPGVSERVVPAVRNALRTVGRAAEGMDRAKADRLRAFAVGLDWSESGLAMSASAVRAAAEVLRTAASKAQADAALALLSPAALRAELSAHGLADGEVFDARFSARRDPETGAVTIRAIDAGGRPYRFSRVASVGSDGVVAPGAPAAFERAEPMTPARARSLVASAAAVQGVDLDEDRTERAVSLVAEFGAGMFATSLRLLAQFVVSLRLDGAAAARNRQTVQYIANEIRGWRSFGFDDPGLESVAEFCKNAQNDLIRMFDEDAGKKNAQFKSGDVSAQFSMDVSRSYYTIGGTRFVFRKGKVADAVAELEKLNLKPAAKRAVTILATQMSAFSSSAVQMRKTDLVVYPPDKPPIDVSVLPGVGAFAGRGSSDLFNFPLLFRDVANIYDISVSEDGRTATVRLVKSENLVVGTEDRENKAFGAVIVEEELTLDVSGEKPVVVGVRLAQTLSDDLGIRRRHLEGIGFPEAPKQGA